MADDELELDVNQSKGSKTTMILLIVVIILLLAIAGAGAWYFMSQGKKDDAAEGSSAEKEKVLAPLTYITMVPEFIVNFEAGSRVRYLQVDLQVASRDPKALETVNIYRPVIRNDILVVLSEASYEELKDRAGKEKLQKKLLNTINRIVLESGSSSKTSKDKKSDNGDIEGPIENLYFTSFIMQ